MKKFFGVLFILFGLGMIIGGIAILVNLNSVDNSFEGRLRNTFSENYRSERDSQQVASFALLAVGAILFILGIIMVASKSSEQRRKEAELMVLRKMQVANSSIDKKNTSISESNKSNDEILKQLERLSKLLEEGKISESEFIQLKKKIIE